MTKKIRSTMDDRSGSMKSIITAKLKGKAKTAAENLALYDLVDNGIAPLNYPVPSPEIIERYRKRTLSNLDSKIESLKRAKKNLQDLPMGEMLYVIASSRVYEAPTGRSWGTRQIDMVVTPIAINLDSVRCILWSQEYTSWETEQISQGRRVSLRPIKLSDIYSFRPWVPNDAALTVNHRYQSPAYKKLAYRV